VKRIFAWATDGAGCYFYRLQLPLLHLPKDQFTVHIGAPGPHMFGYDVVIGQRIAGENETWEQLCRDPRVTAVYDIDDDLMNIDPENAVPYGIYAPLREQTLRNIELADVVTVSTPNLAAYLAQFNENVHVLRNCIPDALVNSPRRPRLGLTVGWGGSMFHAQDWGGVNNVLREVHRRVPSISFRSVGANYMTGVPNVSTVGFTTVNNYHHELDFHVGIAPLVDTPFNDRKSWIKLLEYAARGIPCVASPVGQYGEWVDHGWNGYLAGDRDEWVHYITALVDDDRRTRMGENALEKARQWTISNQIERWVNVYNNQ
jgi:Glycosyl transferases group 1